MKTLFATVCALALLTLAIPSPAQATQRFICAAPCATGSPAYTSIQTAINASSAGDVLLLKAGDAFTECVTVAVDNLTFTTTASIMNFPVPGRRIIGLDVDPTFYDAYMPHWGGCTGGAPTIWVLPGTHTHTINRIKFTGNPKGASDVIRLGSNDTSQVFISEAPTDIDIDQIVILPDPWVGQKRGIQINATNVNITNSYIWVNSVGEDGQAIGMVNTFGPATIINNDLFGGVENILIQGDQTFIKTYGYVKASPTATSSEFTLECFAGTACDAERRALVVGTGSTGSTIVMSTVGGNTPSSNNGSYDGYEVLFTSGVNNTVRTGMLSGYIGLTKTATVSGMVGSPSNGDTAYILPRVQTIATLNVDQLIACDISGVRNYGIVKAVSGNQVTLKAGAEIGTDGDRLTFTGAPPTGSDCRWGAMPGYLTIRHNYIHRIPAWRDDLLVAPGNVTATAITGSGSLAAGTYCYRPIGRWAGYGGNAYSTEPAEACATLVSTGSVKVDWDVIPGGPTGLSYFVWGRVTGTQTQYWEVTGGVHTYTDTGTAGTSPTGGKAARRNSAWSVKKLLEFKSCIECDASFNVLEYNWNDGQDGSAVSVKSSAPVGNAGAYVSEYTRTSNLTFTYNVVRHIGGAFVIVGQEFESHDDIDAPSPATNIVVRNSLFCDSGSQWSGTGIYALNLQNGINGFTFDHNTIDHGNTGLATLSGDVFTGTMAFTSNMMVSNTNGIKASGFAAGTDSLGAYNIDTFLGNAVAAKTGTWPTSNQYPTLANWQAEMTTVPGTCTTSDYKLDGGSTYNTLGADGAQIGADIDALMAYEEAAISGIPADEGPPVDEPSTGGKLRLRLRIR